MLLVYLFYVLTNFVGRRTHPVLAYRYLYVLLNSVLPHMGMGYAIIDNELNADSGDVV
jgi:hypothetical protein